MGLAKAIRTIPAEWMLAEQAGMLGPVVGVDFETFYSSTYSVIQMGNWAYCQDARFKAWAVSVTDGARTCVCTPAEFPWETIAGREWVSHNREFDEAVWIRLREIHHGGAEVTEGIFGAGPARWWCSAAACAFLQLPRDLAGACRAVFGIEVDKSERKRAKGRGECEGRRQQGAAVGTEPGQLELGLVTALRARAGARV